MLGRFFVTFIVLFNMAVSDDPHIIKTFLSLAELHFVILYYLVYVLAW